MEGANGTDIIPGVMDGPGLGTVSPIAGLFDMSDSWNSMIDNFGETADVWGDISAVPAT
jgi:hypothetical protein